jgi:hypothetical protein
MPTRPLLVHIRDKPVLMADLGSERDKRKGAFIEGTAFLRHLISLEAETGLVTPSRDLCDVAKSAAITGWPCAQ